MTDSTRYQPRAWRPRCAAPDAEVDDGQCEMESIADGLAYCRLHRPPHPEDRHYDYHPRYPEPIGLLMSSTIPICYDGWTGETRGDLYFGSINGREVESSHPWEAVEVSAGGHLSWCQLDASPYEGRRHPDSPGARRDKAHGVACSDWMDAMHSAWRAYAAEHGRDPGHVCYQWRYDYCQANPSPPPSRQSLMMHPDEPVTVGGMSRHENENCCPSMT